MENCRSGLCEILGVYPARRIWLALVVFVVGLIPVLLLDRYLLGLLAGYDGNFARMLKELGYLPFWFMAGAGLLLQDWPLWRGEGWCVALRRTALLCGSATLSGLAAEILKLIIRRERPQSLVYESSVFRDWSGDWWRSNDLGTPSSHAAVVFGAAWALWFIFPRQRPLWLLMALGCGLSRVVHQAHVASDVYVAAWVGLAVTLVLRARLWAECRCEPEREAG